MLDWPRSPPPDVHREILTRLSYWLNSHLAHDMDGHFDFLLFFSEIVRPNSAAAPNFPSYQLEWCGGWVVWWLRTRASRWPPPPSEKNEYFLPKLFLNSVNLLTRLIILFLIVRLLYFLDIWLNFELFKLCSYFFNSPRIDSVVFLGSSFYKDVGDDTEDCWFPQHRPENQCFNANSEHAVS